MRGPGRGVASSLTPSPSQPVCPAPSAPCLGARPDFPPSQWPWPLTLIPPIHTPAIEDEYSGPKLEDGKVTITFMKELMQWYKDQKKLHRKCAYQVTPLSRAERACDPRIALQPGLNPITGHERRRVVPAANTC